MLTLGTTTKIFAYLPPAGERSVKCILSGRLGLKQARSDSQSRPSRAVGGGAHRERAGHGGEA
jgi:hypothetical protein